jgi:hypothetical protein
LILNSLVIYKSSENICSSKHFWKRKVKTKLNFPPKLVQKLVWVPHFVKFHSQLNIWCPTMPKLTFLTHNCLTYNFIERRWEKMLCMFQISFFALKKNTCSNLHDKLTLYYDTSFKFDLKVGSRSLFRF